MIPIILSNKVFVAVILAAIISQGIKIILNHFKDRKGFGIPDLVVTGGMPSTHSALVSALFGTLLFEQGLSTLTIISMVLFVIVITDSMGVRRTAGEEAKLINKIIKTEHLKIHQMHFALGHKPIEVLAGTALGFLISIIFAFI